MVQTWVAVDQEDRGSSDQRVDELLVAHVVLPMLFLLTLWPIWLMRQWLTSCVLTVQWLI